ncbi:hypothetical protein K435DRAFT_884784 [Dendrothele bispora CBS 962.96]|uniref:Uncharacterized protein n=1 Tax=Dendrothele bispora (strain CBS 962.96) TaxID=1314807 RepID=A0A4S8KUJ6_DENBC|nr:hypothetical protein K435DRAFT_884784 [Dendrothele bispora CBS 962.96]
MAKRNAQCLAQVMSTATSTTGNESQPANEVQTTPAISAATGRDAVPINGLTQTQVTTVATPLTRPTTPTGNGETVQSVYHSIHAPHNAVVTPSEVAESGYPDDGFTLVTKKSKDLRESNQTMNASQKGKGKDVSDIFTTGHGMATSSDIAPFLRNPPRNTSSSGLQCSWIPGSLFREPTPSPTSADIPSIFSPLTPAFTTPAPTMATSTIAAIPSAPTAQSIAQQNTHTLPAESTMSEGQTCPETGMALDPELNDGLSAQEETQKRKRSRVEPVVDEEDEQLSPPPPSRSRGPEPTPWDAGAPDVQMSNPPPPPLQTHEDTRYPSSAEIAMALAAVEEARRQANRMSGTLPEQPRPLPNFNCIPQLTASTSRTTLEHQQQPSPLPNDAVPSPTIPNQTGLVNTRFVSFTSNQAQPVPPPMQNNTPPVPPLTQNNVPPVPPPTQNNIPPATPNGPPPAANTYIPGGVAAPPPGGYPRVYGFHSGNVREGQAQEQITLWDEIVATRGGLLIRMFDPTPDPIAAQQQMTRAVRDTIPSHAMPTVAPPERIEGSSSQPPTHFLVMGISPNDVQHLIDRRIIDTAHGAFITIPYNPNPDHFVMTLQGHTFREDQAVEAQQAFRMQLSREPHLSHFISTHRDNLPAHLTPEEAIAITLNCLRAQPIRMGHPEGVERIYWNVYAPPPSRHLPYYQEWINLIRSAGPFPNPSGVLVVVASTTPLDIAVSCWFRVGVEPPHKLEPPLTTPNSRILPREPKEVLGEPQEVEDPNEEEEERMEGDFSASRTIDILR